MKISSWLMEGSGGGRRLWFGGGSLLGFVGGRRLHNLRFFSLAKGRRRLSELMTLSFCCCCGCPEAEEEEGAMACFWG